MDAGYLIQSSKVSMQIWMHTPFLGCMDAIREDIPHPPVCAAMAIFHQSLKFNSRQPLNFPGDFPGSMHEW
jgi:hypothetical protein